MNVRIGAVETGETFVNLLWAEDAHGPPPKNVTAPTLESATEDVAEIERVLPDDLSGSRVLVDGSISVRVWIDVPSIKRITFGTIDREFPSASLDTSS